MASHVLVFYYIGLGFSVISILFSLFITLMQLIVPKLRKFPGNLFTMISISLLVYNCHWLSADPGVHDFLSANSALCEFLGLVLMFFYFLGYNYTTCLSIEILFKLQNRTNIHHKKRLLSYHLLSWLISIIFCVFLYVYKGLGMSSFETCSVNDKQKIHVLEFLPLVLNEPIIWYCLIKILIGTEKKYASITINFAYIVLALSITWFFPAFIKFIMFATGKNGVWIFIGYFIGAVSGICVGLSRLSNKKVIAEIKKKFSKSNYKIKTHLLSNESRNSLKVTAEDHSASFAEISQMDLFFNFYELLGKNVKLI
jgi:hypothetical protein